MYNYTSGRVKKETRTGITSDRYEFLGLNQAEPDLGDPLVGPSSVGANPSPPSVSGDQYLLVANKNNPGKRYWVASSNILTGGLIPGSFTIFDDNIQVGAANSFNVFNLVGDIVSVDPVGPGSADQTGIATIRFSLRAPGQLNQIMYHGSGGTIQGASGFVYSSGNIGIGSNTPTELLDVNGNGKFFGSVTASSFVGDLTGTASFASGFSTTANIETTGIITASSFVGNLTGDATGLSTTSSINTTGIITASSFIGNLTGTATTATTAVGLDTTSSINTSGIITASSFTGNLTGVASTATIATTALGVSTTININTSGIITALSFTGNLTGTSTTSTNVIGGIASVSSLSVSGVTTIGSASTSTNTPLQVETYGIKTGTGNFIASVGVTTFIDSFSITTTDFKLTEYSVHIGFSSSIQVQKVLVMQDGAVANAESYGIMYNQSALVSIGATLDGTDCKLQVTPQSGVNGVTTYRFVRGSLL
jgi:hypothetical protein